jgi:hypothetical protein
VTPKKHQKPQFFRATSEAFDPIWGSYFSQLHLIVPNQGSWRVFNIVGYIPMTLAMMNIHELIGMNHHTTFVESPRNPQLITT